MRDTASWRKNLVTHLKKQWPEESTVAPADICNVELGLYTLSQLLPAAPAHSLWALLTGYDFPLVEMQNWTATQRQMLANARHLLPYFKGKYQWQQLALKRYLSLNERLRGYEVDAQLCGFNRRDVTLAYERFSIYDKVLTAPLPHRQDKLQWATSGRYLYDGSHYRESVTIPDELVLSPPTGHKLNGKAERPPLTISMDDLLVTARWIDDRLAAQDSGKASFEAILRRVRLELFATDGQLKASGRLSLDGMTHLIGMVSSGKSTLMSVLSVWMARHDLRVTLVVGSVIEALSRAKLFSDLGLSVAPILGRTNRERHTNRLHRILAAESPFESSLQHQHIGFRWLSTICPLDGLRDNQPQPLPAKYQPCQNLYLLDDKGRRKDYACPVYNDCSFHQAQRDLVDASIWITTSYGLVYRQVDKQLNVEDIRFFELVYRCSDLVIIDEADQVQVQLDMMFSPNQILVSRGQTAWLNQLFQRVVTQLNQEGLAQVAHKDVANWCQAINVANTVTTKIYALLQSEITLRRQVEQDYFSDWILFERLAERLIKDWKAQRQQPDSATTLPEIFETYLKDPLGEKQDHPLVALAQKSLASTNNDRTRQEIAAWLAEQAEFTATLSDAERQQVAIQFEFALLVTVLQDRLNYIVYNWKQVEVPLKLEGGSSLMFHRPPRDYESLMPNAPMGNILAFQYIRSLGNSNEPGQLRFFRFMGVGRWLLLRFHEIFAADGLAGPHVLLLSGTSWAGTSPGQHVQVPVNGILQAPDEEIRAIEQSVFQFKPFYDREGQPIRISGLNGQARIAALKEVLHQLARQHKLSHTSRLEQERDRLPERRQRILLVVGSYHEARIAREYLESIRSDLQGQILNLVADDDEFESDFDRGMSLQRGLVHQFSQTGGWILIAPLLAIERGHNILNEDYQAAIGAAYFLVRPHPRPDDISLPIQFLNRWAIERSADVTWLAEQLPNQSLSLDEVASVFRKRAFRYWRHLLRMPMVYSTLPDYERRAVTWSQLVTIWQLIGRLIRGGSQARIYFCDAPFALNTAYQEDQNDDPQTSLLVSFKDVLRPYCTDTSKISKQERALVRALYGPFYTALKNMGGLADGL